MIGLIKIFKQAKNLLVGTTEFYFYINGKIQDGGSEGGSVSSGAFGFIFPIAPASFGICKAIGDFYNIEIYPKYIMIMVIFILACIYLFFIRIALILLFAVLFLFVNELADNFLYSYLML